jgi:hypothetical protein
VGIFSKKQKIIPRRRSVDSTIQPEPKVVIKSNFFKKNNNLSGYSSTVQDKSPRIQHHHLSLKRKNLSVILLITILIIVSLSLLISQFTAKVSIKITNSTTKSVETTRYQNSIQDYLNASPLSRLRFVLDESKLNEFVMINLNEIGEIVQNTTIGIGVTEFSVTLREPVASWKIGDKQYYVDKDGVAFEVNLFDEPDVKIIDNSGAVVETGSASVSRRFLGFVGRVVSLSNNKGYQVLEAVLPENTTRQLDIRLSESNLLVKMTIDRSAADQVGDMSRAVEHMLAKGSLPSYIDVRVDDRVFYK